MTYEKFLLSRFPKLSDLLVFFLEVIRNPPADFKWNMDTFGELDVESESNARIGCIGCAATSAILKLAGKNGKDWTLLEGCQWLGLSDICEFSKLEYFFDALRLGKAMYLNEVYPGVMSFHPDVCFTWRFTNKNKAEWSEQLGNIERFIQQLKENNL